MSLKTSLTSSSDSEEPYISFAGPSNPNAQEDCGTVPAVREIGRHSLCQELPSALGKQADVKRCINPIFGKKSLLERRISQATCASMQAASSSMSTSSSQASCAKEILNPLFGLPDLKDFEDEELAKLKYANILANLDYNKIAEKWTYNQIAAREVLSRTFLSYSVFRNLSHLLNRKPRPKSLKSKELMKQLLMSGAVTSCLLNTAALASENLLKFVEVNNRKSPCITDALKVLKGLESHAHVLDFTSKNSSVDQLLDLYGFCSSSDLAEMAGRDMVIRLLFETKKNYEELLVWLKVFFSRSKNLKPMIDFLQKSELSNEKGGLHSDMSFALGPFSPMIPKINSSSVIRAFFLGDAPNIASVTVNRDPFIFQDPQSAHHLRKESYFHQLLLKCYSGLNVEVPLPKFCDHEVSALLSGQDVDTMSLQLLSGCTVESWSMADRLIRFLFPGLNACPFIFKMPQSTKVEIQVIRVDQFIVIQKKTYDICLRKNPYYPLSFHKFPNPLCSIVFEWRVHSVRDKDKWQEKGELSIKEVDFSRSIAPYEMREITATLSKACPLPPDWKSLPYPSVLREFPDS